MPLYDFTCRVCGRTFEAMAAMDGGEEICVCGGSARRLVSVGRGYRADGDWLASVAAVAEKDSDKPHVRAFLAEPSRANYRRWIRGEGIRPLEDGESRRRATTPPAVSHEVLERFKARRSRV
ncbi:zinc ribbon domain-containing protein [Desulfovibrio aerotolerans]|uniref:Zinc ribbon domain-containing protein n=1 Tax=Solidesulfovibrio aerotolerans TaxID=295255 RepID=A0A7C9MQU4_9BACT|nr:zinc ribbon domain-containing protein [Solidesulfovibrio aerotolerans]MYL84872.1 zinc ribbon domain-containing protein [Solidesulfovibrio aerotolerans]